MASFMGGCNYVLHGMKGMDVQRCFAFMIMVMVLLRGVGGGDEGETKGSKQTFVIFVNREKGER